MAEDKFLQRRESRNMMKVAKNQKAAANSILEAVMSRTDRPTRVKIVVKKEEVEQVLEAIRGARGSTSLRRGLAPPSLEQRLNLLRRRQILRAAAHVKGRSRVGPWRPVLQSIPE